MFFLCSSCIVDSIHDVMLVLVLLLFGAWQLKVENPCIDFCGFDTAYIHAVSNAQKLYIRSPSNRDNFLTY